MSPTPAGETVRGPGPGSGPRADATAATRRVVFIGGTGLAALAAAAAWFLFAANDPPPRPAPRGRTMSLLTVDRPFPDGGRFPGDPYIGPKACLACHPGECALYSHSGHARTLSTAARRKLSREVDGTSVADPEYPGISWSFRFNDGRLYVARRSPESAEEIVAEYAFGSGHHAVTFVNMVDATVPAILEHRMTYFARTRTFGLTPGHETVPKPPGLTPLGGLPPPRDARFCFECHSTQVSTGEDLRIDEDLLIPNVSCERCHGPGRAHVVAAHRGASASELRLPFGPERSYTAEAVIRLCGSCHRHPGKPGVGPLDPENPRLARFQPVGILQSRCFRESKGGFSCVTCHDPHARASTDRLAYNTTCQTCHRSGTSVPPPSIAPDENAIAALPCPREPAGDCVACHMPRVDAGQGVLFADHWIRLKGRGDSRSSGQAAPHPATPVRP